MLVGKKDRILRFCVDYRRLNMKTMTHSYPLPRMEDCIDSLGDAAVFSTLDCNSGYWKIPADPSDREKTTFTTLCGTFRYKRMPFGLNNARRPSGELQTSSSQECAGRSAWSIWMTSLSSLRTMRPTSTTSTSC